MRYEKAYERRERRQAEAADRQAEYDKLTTHQKLARVTRNGYADSRQAARLAAQLVEEKKN